MWVSDSDGGRRAGAAINVSAQPLNKQQVQLASHIIEPPKTEVVRIPDLLQTTKNLSFSVH